MKSLEIRLVSRPLGAPSDADFERVEIELPQIGPGQVLVRNLVLSVDPYLRTRMRGAQPLNAPMHGEALGRVIQSQSPDFQEGDIVISQNGMREAFVDDAGQLRKITPDPGLPLSVYLHVFGRTGFTAYGGLLKIGAMQPGETVFVSAAAGAVGSVVAQIAKLRGGTVIGSAGSAAKTDWLRSLGLDHVINYHDRPIGESLAATGCEIDVYFDNVGGAHLDAALLQMRSLGRIAVCGMISGYNGEDAPIRNLPAIMHKRVNIRGFYGADFETLRSQFDTDMGAWLRQGHIKYRETFHEGVMNAPRALMGVLAGENIGKMLVTVPE